jgi:hypothetical protein
MNAVQALQCGEPSVFKLVDLPYPTPRPAEIAIDVTHPPVGLLDLLFRKGRFKNVTGIASISDSGQKLKLSSSKRCAQKQSHWSCIQTGGCEPLS